MLTFLTNPQGLGVMQNRMTNRCFNINFYFWTEPDKAEVSRLAKNYLPILFNVYIKVPAAGESTAHKLPVMETIRAYLTVTDQQVRC